MNQKQPRILAIAPSTRGFGFAILEGKDQFVECGNKSLRGDKNAKCLSALEKMIRQYLPSVLVLQNYEVADSRRSPRIRELGRELRALAARNQVKVARFSDRKVRRAFFADGKGTKHALAEILAKRFPNELAHQLPPKRKPWETEDQRMGTFEAVALALMCK